MSLPVDNLTKKRHVVDLMYVAGALAAAAVLASLWAGRTRVSAEAAVPPPPPPPPQEVRTPDVAPPPPPPPQYWKSVPPRPVKDPFVKSDNCIKTPDLPHPGKAVAYPPPPPKPIPNYKAAGRVAVPPPVYPSSISKPMDNAAGGIGPPRSRYGP